jgi:hypothetical protein
MKPSDYIKRGWTQGTAARNLVAERVNATSPYAVCWCIFGALLAADRIKSGATRYKLQCHLRQDPVDWNDTPGRTKEEVIAALEAIGE